MGAWPRVKEAFPNLDNKTGHWQQRGNEQSKPGPSARATAAFITAAKCLDLLHWQA